MYDEVVPASLRAWTVLPRGQPDRGQRRLHRKVGGVAQVVEDSRERHLRPESLPHAQRSDAERTTPLAAAAPSGQPAARAGRRTTASARSPGTAPRTAASPARPARRRSRARCRSGSPRRSARRARRGPPTSGAPAAASAARAGRSRSDAMAGKARITRARTITSGERPAARSTTAMAAAATVVRTAATTHPARARDRPAATPRPRAHGQRALLTAASAPDSSSWIAIASSRRVSSKIWR
jgi:hypothetical protein